MKYTVYKTTNLVNGKQYIGKHATVDPNDEYLGSGVQLLRAIAKYGRQNFVKEVLFAYDTAEEMNAKEAELVTEEIVASSSFYNMCLGGNGGAIVLYPEHPQYDEIRQKLSVAQQARKEEISRIAKENHRLKKVGMYGKTQSEHQRSVTSKRCKGTKRDPAHVAAQRESIIKTLSDPNYVHPNKGRKLSADHLEKMRQANLQSPKLTCSNCGKTMDVRNFNKYKHGDSCTQKAST